MRMRLLLGFALLFCGCATSSNVVVGHASAGPMAEYRSAYLVTHGDREADMDSMLQRELLARGFEVSVGPDGSRASEGAQLLIKYTDAWQWDMRMYLKTFDLLVFDARSGVLLAQGSWKNSKFHGFQQGDDVIPGVVSETFGKLGVKR